MTLASHDYVVIDFETFYDSAAKYSLYNLTTIEYVRSQRFKSYGASVKIDGSPSVWLDHDSLVLWLSGVDWSRTTAISHNALFDAFVLAMHYGVTPHRYLCTQKMARYVLGQSVRGHGLAEVFKHYTGRDAKQHGEALKALDGVTEPTPTMLANLGEYARDDADECWEIFCHMFPHMPAVEYDRLSWCVKMFTQPVLMLDVDKLDAVHKYEALQKAQALASIGETAKTIRSRTQFPEILKAAGLGSHGFPDVPMKVSPTTKKDTFAFAKSDKDFVDLMDLKNEDGTEHRIASLVRTKLKVTSTIEETRARRLAEVARRMGGYLPVPLNYCGAMPTNRLSGGQLLNLQNLGRGSKIRDAIVAPEGYVIVAADLSNIELRINMVNAHEHQAVADLKSGEDLYCKFAAELYGYPVFKGQHKIERQVGKVAELSLGYASGWETFRQMLYDQADGMWVSRQFAEAAVATYRAGKPALQLLWNGFKQYLEAMEQGKGMANFTGAPVTLASDGMVLPSGFKIKYPNLKSTMATNKWGGVSKQFEYTRYSKDNPSGRGKIWHGQLVENLAQALAREVLADIQDRVYLRTGMLPALQVHDELVFVVHADHGQWLLDLCIEEMSRPLAWWPALPLAAEGAIGKSYGDAK
jgi:DNA polymerase